jgi:hypothetical protein
VQGAVCRVQDAGCTGFEFTVQDLELRIGGWGFEVKGLGFGVRV